MIYNDRCIDCGRCVSVCPHHAYSVRSDTMDRLKDFKYNIAIPDTIFYGQFKNLYDMNIVNEGLVRLGFDDVYPAAIGAELLSDLWKTDGDSVFGPGLVRVSSECPAVVRLIAMEYQELIPNVVDSLSAFELTGGAGPPGGGGKDRPPARGDRHRPDLPLPRQEHPGILPHRPGKAGGGITPCPSATCT